MTVPAHSGQPARALVTGGSRRVGRAIAIALAEGGCDVDITFRTSAEEATEVVSHIRGIGREARSFELELSESSEVSKFLEQYRRERTRLDVLVHNASVYRPTPLASLEASAAAQFMQVNAISPLLLSAGLAGLLRGSILTGGGAIVCMCDMHAMGRPRKDFAPYTMSKAALAEMVRSLALDLAPEIRVTGVAPGVVAFPESGYESDEGMQQRYLERVPLRRSGTEDDAAAMVRWLALEASYVTGEVIRLDGGRWLA